jgi:archaellum component FlaC
MDLETIEKRINELENQLSSIKKAITNQNAKANQAPLFRLRPDA